MKDVDFCISRCKTDILFFPCRDFLYPFAAAEADGAPNGFYNLVGFECGINPERGNAKHRTRDYS